MYEEEVPGLPFSIKQAETAVPVFIGFTEKIPFENKPLKVHSMEEYATIFGGPESMQLFASIRDGKLTGAISPSPQKYQMFEALRWYFANDGGPCYISSAGSYEASATSPKQMYTDLNHALNRLESEEDPTIIVIPDAYVAGEHMGYRLYRNALQQCGLLKDRVTLLDVYCLDHTENVEHRIRSFREHIGHDFLNYGAAYAPYIRSTHRRLMNESTCYLNIGENTFFLRLPEDSDPRQLEYSLFHRHPDLYLAIQQGLIHSENEVILAPSAAIAAVCCQIDSLRGVWKAPANVPLKAVIGPLQRITDEEQQQMIRTESGKSVNPIRHFAGKGTLVWGARSLAGNDPEWRYIHIRRFCNMLEKTLKRSIQPFLFHPNDSNNWINVQAMIEYFLLQLWRLGALHGQQKKHAFYVSVGLDKSMNTADIRAGKLIVEIGLALMRPAEFLSLRLTYGMAGNTEKEQNE